MTIIPRRYRCTGCSERFEFTHRDAVYHLSPEPLGTQVADGALYSARAARLVPRLRPRLPGGRHPAFACV